MCKQGLYFSSMFSKLHLLSDNYKIIKKEYLENTNDLLEWPEKYLYDSDKEWKVIPLYAFGEWKTNKFPETTKILKKIPNLRTALFSKLGPKTTLKPHRGWADLSNYVLRTHLGIQVPNGKCGIVVKNSFRQIEEGSLITFDDSKLHYGINETDKERVVLIVDIERPWWVPFGESTVPKTPELENLVKNTIRSDYKT